MFRLFVREKPKFWRYFRYAFLALALLAASFTLYLDFRVEDHQEPSARLSLRHVCRLTRSNENAPLCRCRRKVTDGSIAAGTIFQFPAS